MRIPGRIQRHIVIAVVVLVAACGTDDVPAPGPTPCSAEWQQWVETRLTTGDGQGHGPDIGSDEWKSVVEFKLGVRGDPSVPSRDSDEWCRFVDERVRVSN